MIFKIFRIFRALNWPIILCVCFWLALASGCCAF